MCVSFTLGDYNRNIIEVSIHNVFFMNCFRQRVTDQAMLSTREQAWGLLLGFEEFGDYISIPKYILFSISFSVV